MSSTLSQEEVDALLKGLADGEVSLAGAEAPAGVVRPAQLAAEDRVAGGRLPAIEVVHDRLARALPQALAALVGVTATVDRGDAEALRFRTFRERIAPGSSLVVFGLAPLPGQGLLVLAPALTFEMIDRIYGGSGRVPNDLEKREYSAIALQTVRRIATRLLRVLDKAFEPVLAIETALARIELEPAALSFAAADETVLALELACDLGGGVGRLGVVLSQTSLEALRRRLGEAPARSANFDSASAGTIHTAISQAEVMLTAELGRRELTAREVLRLRVGDLIALPTRDEDPLVVRVEGRRMIRGHAGVSRGHNAVRILGFEAGE